MGYVYRRILVGDVISDHLAIKEGDGFFQVRLVLLQESSMGSCFLLKILLALLKFPKVIFLICLRHQPQRILRKS